MDSKGTRRFNAGDMLDMGLWEPSWDRIFPATGAQYADTLHHRWIELQCLAFYWSNDDMSREVAASPHQYMQEISPFI
jgi:hypothetical protein